MSVKLISKFQVADKEYEEVLKKLVSEHTSGTACKSAPAKDDDVVIAGSGNVCHSEGLSCYTEHFPLN